MQPLFSAPAPAIPGSPQPDAGSADEFEDITESASPKVQALLALKEIEFDRATGKLSDEDYEQLKSKYSKVALDAIKAEEQGPAEADAADAAEELIRRMAEGGGVVCPTCGPRPETDAAFCSNCGQRLVVQEPKAVRWAAYCEACGAPLSEGAKFCAECGAKVMLTLTK